VGKSVGFHVIRQAFPSAKGVLVGFHIDVASSKPDVFEFQAHTLFRTRLPLEADAPASA
jgi:hypothetical protein